MFFSRGLVDMKPPEKMKKKNNTRRAKALSTGKIVIIQVRGKRVLSGNRLEGKRLSYERKQEVKGVKGVEKKTRDKVKKDAKIGRIQREECKREQKEAKVKRRKYLARSNARRKYKDKIELKL